VQFQRGEQDAPGAECEKPSGRLLASGRSMIRVIASGAGSRSPAEKDAAATGPAAPGRRSAVARFWFATHGRYPDARGVTGQLAKERAVSAAASLG